MASFKKDENKAQDSWAIGLCGCCEIGCCQVCYACCLPACALASYRKEFDQSNWCFNCLCFNIYMFRSIIRNGYNIEGNCCADWCVVLWCSCCALTQIKGEINSREVSSVKNDARGVWAYGIYECWHTGFWTCCFGFFCPCVSIPCSLSDHDGSNCCFNWLCTQTPTLCAGCLLFQALTWPSLLMSWANCCTMAIVARSIIRNRDALSGSCCGDCCLGCCCVCCVSVQLRAEIKAIEIAALSPGRAHMLVSHRKVLTEAEKKMKKENAPPPVVKKT